MGRRRKRNKGGLAKIRYQEDVLVRFWMFYMRIKGCENRDIAGRIGMLRSYAEVAKVDRIEYYREIRKGERPPVPCGPCGVCLGKPSVYWHHIIQAQHGGTNDPGNLMPICRDCHKAIHPWMRKKIPIAKCVSTDMAPRLVAKRPERYFYYG